jgi:hypothetical protein
VIFGCINDRHRHPCVSHGAVWTCMGRGETLGIVGILAVIACVMRSGQLCSLVQCSAAKHNASETN